MRSWNDKRAVIIGAGPAGLTAAYELLKRTKIKPVVVEQSDIVGGISRTVNYKGNRIDIGGHRFFSKSDQVMRWWCDMLPLQRLNGRPVDVGWQSKLPAPETTGQDPDPNEIDAVMLVRSRKSRIYYQGKLFDYPVSLSKQTILNLGLMRLLKIGFSYAKASLFPIRHEQNLEDFLINRFGKELYLTFFKSYTEKVWGVPCQEISAAWGAQRIKGMSIRKAVLHALARPFARREDVAQKKTETSLIEQFLYPKYGPGQMWETCAEKVKAMGGEITMNVKVDRVLVNGDQVIGVTGIDQKTNKAVTFEGDYFFSTMPVSELTRAIGDGMPADIRKIGEGLTYRDFITVGLLLSELKVYGHTEDDEPLTDNWIYIQEPDVRVGRLQIFNNWSPYMVADPSKTWVGLEYFCNDTDELWRLNDAEMADLAAKELARIGRVDKCDVLDWTVIRMPKTYPAYFGTYSRFDELREYLDRLDNLYLIGRNGMHRYNNQDHSMLTAMTAVDNIIAGRHDKSNIWSVNTEQEYHEDKEETNRPRATSSSESR